MNLLVLLSFYMISQKHGKFRRFWIDSIDHYPTDWLELKTMLTEIMRKIHIEHRVAAATVSLERHLPGRSMMRYSGYVRKKIPILRQYDGMFRLVLKSSVRELTVKEASFNYTLASLRSDFWQMERGIKWRSPPLIPKEHLNLLDPRTFLMEPSSTRFASYRRDPCSTYGSGLEKLRSQPPRHLREPHPDYEMHKKRLDRRLTS